jgi:hypothetical protein
MNAQIVLAKLNLHNTDSVEHFEEIRGERRK